MNVRFVVNLTVLFALSSGVACSATGDGPRTGGLNGAGATSSTGAQPNNGSAGLDLNTNGGSSVVGKDPNDPRDVPVRPKICDAGGATCTCLRLALVGTLESSAKAHDTQPFIDWLNGNSDGTAKVTMVSTKPTMDAAFLANYDILVIANVNGWTFSADEKAAVADWVKVQGGGIVTLTGFASTATEAAATSQLVEFAGMGYSGTAQTQWTAPATGNTTPITYKGGSADLRNCLNLWSNANDKEASQTTAIKFTPQAAPLEKLTASLDYVGAYIGWPVNAPAGSTVIAKDPATGANMAVAYEVQGKGRIFSFGDEWIVFTTLWQPTGTFIDQNMNASNPCWVAPQGTTPSFFHSARSLYQAKQFWYNIINWVAPPSECNFTIADPDVVK
jgi:hypothetical protein